MRFLAYMRGCAMCYYAVQAVIKINSTLPIEEHIDMINIFSGDPRLSVLAKYYKNDDPYEWGVPILVLDVKKIQKRFDSYQATYGERIIIAGVYPVKEYAKLVENLA